MQPISIITNEGAPFGLAPALNYLRAHGREAWMVDYYGRIVWRRWFAFYEEAKQEDKAFRWVQRLPNQWIHHYPTNESPDSDQNSHRHPWPTRSVMLKGAYTELVNETITHARRAISMQFQSHRDSHRVTEVDADTWTLFFHGFRRQPWNFLLNSCKTLCPACSAAGTECIKGDRVLDHNQLYDFLGETHLRWEIASPAVEDDLRRRRRACAKMGLVPPSRDQARALLRSRLAVQRAKPMPVVRF